MTPVEAKAFADSEQEEIADFSAKAKKMNHEELNDLLNAQIEKHKPLHQKKVAIAMRMLILSQEIRVRMLKKAFPDVKVQEVTTLCQLLPSDHVVGDTEKWIAAIQAQGRTPKTMQVDRVNRSIVLLE